jgi:hypothetical protein
VRQGVFLEAPDLLLHDQFLSEKQLVVHGEHALLELLLLLGQPFPSLFEPILPSPLLQHQPFLLGLADSLGAMEVVGESLEKKEGLAVAFPMYQNWRECLPSGPTNKQLLLL